MKIYTGETIEGINRNRHDVVCSDVEFNKCKFSNSFISPVSVRPDPRQMGTLRNAVFKNCPISETCSDYFGKLENVVFDNVKISGYLRLQGFLFNQFKIQGRCKSIYLGSKLQDPWKIWVDGRGRYSTAEELETFNDYCDDYYKSVEWAIDISEGEFETCSIYGVPLELIRRDQQTQVIVRHNKLQNGSWKELSFKDTTLKFELESAKKDFLLIAGKLSKYYERVVHDINLLKEAGLAD